MLFTSGCIAFVVGLVLAHLAGMRLASRLDVRPGHVRRAMPTLPLQQYAVGARWSRGLRRVERALLPILRAEPAGVEAAPLAGRIDEPLALVVAVLERLREEVPCRLRVTRSGRILHDFEPAALAELASRRRRTRPWLLLVYLLGLFSNLGAAWPVITILFVASSTLGQVLRGGQDATTIGLIGLLSLAGLVLLTVGVGYAMTGLLRPLRAGPKLGQAEVPEGQPDRFETGASWGAVFGWNDGRRKRRSSASGGSSSSDGNNLGQAIIIAVLVAIIAAALVVIYIWARGIWRAISARRRAIDSTPSRWVRERATVDTFERFVPTNDLVGRLSGALRRLLARRRPMDEDLGPRVLVRAARRSGHVTALEIALAEGLDLAEAVEVGTRLCTALDGRIQAIDGEVVFSFPARVLAQVWAGEDPNLWAEFLTFEQRGPTLRRRPEQAGDRLPVNLVGLRAGHLEAASRLAAGAWLMAATGLTLFVADLPAGWNRYTLGIPEWAHGLSAGGRVALVLILCGFAMATTILAAAAHYATRVEAILGIRRDARRAAFQEIVELCRHSDAAVIDLRDQVRRLEREFSLAWPKLPDGLLSAEMIGVAADLDLAPGDVEGVWQIDALRERIARAAAVEPEPVEAAAPADDPVIFDTQVELDRITALI